jgi:hypothetical protein
MSMPGLPFGKTIIYKGLEHTVQGRNKRFSSFRHFLPLFSELG